MEEPLLRSQSTQSQSSGSSNKVSFSEPNSACSEGSIYGPLKRSWSQRTFGRMSPGSARGGLFTLTSSALGGSILLLPFIAKQCGVMLAVIILILGAAINKWSLDQVVHAVDKYSIYSYPDLLNAVLGNWAKRICEFLIVIYAIGILIGFQIIIGDLSCLIAESLSIELPPQYQRIIVMCVMNWGLMIPLSSFRDLSKLRFTATVGVISLTYIVLLTLTEFPFFAEENGLHEVEYFKVNQNIFSCISVCLLGYFCHTNVCSVHGQIDNPTKRRMEKITSRCVLIQLMLYSSLVVFGYLSTLDATPKVFIRRPSPEVIDLDWAMVVGRCLFVITLVMAVSINLHPCRKALFNGINRPDPPMWQHLLVTYLFLEITLLLAIITPDVMCVFNILGALCSITLLAIFPGLLYIYTRKVTIMKKATIWAMMAAMIGVAIATICVTFATISNE